MLRHAEKWLEEVGRLEMSQWVPPYDGVTGAEEVNQVLNQEQMEKQQIH